MRFDVVLWKWNYVVVWRPGDVEVGYSASLKMEMEGRLQSAIFQCLCKDEKVAGNGAPLTELTRHDRSDTNNSVHTKHGTTSTTKFCLRLLRLPRGPALGNVRINFNPPALSNLALAKRLSKSDFTRNSSFNDSLVLVRGNYLPGASTSLYT